MDMNSIDTSNWKIINLEHGKDYLTFKAPIDSVELSMKEVPPLLNPEVHIRDAFENPIGTLPLAEIVSSFKGSCNKELTVAITVSDITRPVPYRGDNGILKPLLSVLKSAGIKASNISIVVGTGTHRASTHEEKIQMFGEDIVNFYKIIDHDHKDKSQLVPVGLTSCGTEVFVNKHFACADIRIATGLVESHFMAGFSGGPKAICPGLVDLKTIEKFHSPQFLESEKATNLIIEGNPCYIEAFDVAKKVGIHFLVNVTLNKEMKITGIFAGDLEKAHKEATKYVVSYVGVPIKEEFDIVITHSGYVGRNHYQTAKAAVGAEPAVCCGGIIIIGANNNDVEPIGDLEYKTLIHLLKMQGPSGYVNTISQKDWVFTKDQWQPEEWARALRKTGEEGLIYCTVDIKPEQFDILPGVSGYKFLTYEDSKLNRIDKVSKMIENALKYSVYYIKNKKHRIPSIAIIHDGPYCIPVKKQIIQN